MQNETSIESVITRELLDNSMDYTQYFNLVKDLLEEGKTTGTNQNEAYLKHAKLNLQRMKRVYKTTAISEQLENTLKSMKKGMIWVVLTEGWCGDAAQNLPAIARFAETSSAIGLKILLRDENPQIMNAYLTNGNKAIPKLIALDSDTLEELFVWGPRPAKFQQMVTAHKHNPTSSNEEFNENLHKQYTLDKTTSLQKEIDGLLTNFA